MQLLPFDPRQSTSAGDANGDAKPVIPRWETAVLALSFLVIWLWFLARQSTFRAPGASLSPWWQVPLVVALAALLVVFWRRLGRVRRVFRDYQNPRDEG